MTETRPTGVYQHEPFTVEGLLPEYASPKLREVWDKFIQKAGATAPEEPSPLMLLDTPLGAALNPLDNPYALQTRYTEDMVGLEQHTIEDDRHYLLVQTELTEEDDVTLRQHPNFVGIEPPNNLFPYHTAVFSRFKPENLEAYAVAQEAVFAHAHLYRTIKECQIGLTPWWTLLQKDWETQLAYDSDLTHRIFKNWPKEDTPEEEAIAEEKRATLRLKAWSDGWDGDGPVPLPIPDAF